MATPITDADSRQAVGNQRGFRMVEQDGFVGVRVLSNAVAIFNRQGLKCQVRHGVDMDLLAEALCGLAGLIPGAVVRDDEGNALSGGR